MRGLKLDAADIRILTAVQKHGRLSKASLAEMVNLSATPCWARLKRLEKAGIIRGYRADISLNGVAEVTTVFVKLSLEKHRREDFERFENRVLATEEITECISTGGGFDYIIKFVVSGLSAFQELIEQLLNEKVGIERYFIYVVTRQIKSSSPNLTRYFEHR